LPNEAQATFGGADCGHRPLDEVLQGVWRAVTFVHQKTWKLVIVLGFLQCLVHRSQAQQITEIGRFWTLGGTVQLLPTGQVLTEEDGTRKVFTYRQGRYVRTDPNANRTTTPPYSRWIYFDWASIDWHDQLDKNDSDIPAGRFWPREAKVKKVIYLTPRSAPKVTALICYTLKEPPEQSSGTSQRIVVTAVMGKRTEEGYKYVQLWTKILQTESSYGELIVQDIPRAGRTLVLYSASAGGSTESEQLNLYTIQD